MVPLGNLETDCAISIIDNLYARSLSLHKHILWYSSNGVPDLGGHEDQDFRSYFQEELENPEMVNKGFYRGYTVEINISDLSINTILQSDFLKEFEEATMTEKQNQGYHNKSKGKHPNAVQDNATTTQFDTDLDEFITCSASFKKLKDLVTIWYEDYIKNDDYSAYFLLQNFYRWLSSPQSSKLFDPLILKLVHKLMKKNFFQLLLRLKQLGCKVVYANFNKMFLFTDKKTFDEADSHTNFVLAQLKTTQLFQYIELQPVEFYSTLLFKDLYNYGGIKESDSAHVLSRWDIALHLPPVTKNKFLYIIGKFITMVDHRNKKTLKKTAAGETIPDEDRELSP